MLYIDDKKIKVIKQDIYVGKFINQGENGYNINIHLSFINHESNEEGYLNLIVGFEKENDINAFLNKEYNGIPFNDDKQYIYFEVFDTEKFLDTEIESKTKIKLKGIKDGKVAASFEINDKLIKIIFKGYLDIIY